MSEVVRMPFGLYKGERLENVPSDYLMWIVENIEDKDWLTSEAQNQLDLRGGRGVSR